MISGLVGLWAGGKEDAAARVVAAPRLAGSGGRVGPVQRVVDRGARRATAHLHGNRGLVVCAAIG